MRRRAAGSTVQEIPDSPETPKKKKVAPQPGSRWAASDWGKTNGYGTPQRKGLIRGGRYAEAGHYGKIELLVPENVQRKTGAKTEAEACLVSLGKECLQRAADGKCMGGDRAL